MISFVICPKRGNSIINKPYENLVNAILEVGNQIELEDLQRKVRKSVGVES